MHILIMLIPCLQVCLIVKSLSFRECKNIAAKFVLNRTWYDSPEESRCELHWLPIRARIQHKVLSVMYKSLNGMAHSIYKTSLPYIQLPDPASDQKNHFNSWSYHLQKERHWLAEPSAV